MADSQPARREDERRRTTERSRSDNASALASPPLAGNAPAPAAARAAVAGPDLSAFDGWTQARVTLDGRVWLIARNGHDALASQWRALASQARAAIAIAGPTLMRIELLGGDEVLGYLAVGEASVQWTPRRGGADASYSGAVPAAQVGESLEEVRRVR
jgi:hypothetical protein